MNVNAKISLYHSYKDPVPVNDTSIEGFCSSVFHGEYSKEVSIIRAESDKENRDKLKALLPAVTISGTFSHREEKSLIAHSGFIALDFDAKGNPDVTNWPEIRDSIARLPEVLFCALSVSGLGCFAIIPIEDPKQHKAQFKALQVDFKTLGYVVDNSCSDVSRLRGISSDTDAKYKPSAVAYRRIFKEKPVARPVFREDSSDLVKTIKQICDNGIDITSDYKYWYEIGAALANEMGEGGRVYFHALSGFHPEYSPEKCDRQYDKCMGNPKHFSKGTIFYYAKMSNILNN